MRRIAELWIRKAAETRRRNEMSESWHNVDHNGGRASMFRKRELNLLTSPMIMLSAGAILGVIALASPADARDLTIVGYGGSFQDSLRTVFFKPFSEDAKISVKDIPYDGGIGILRAKVQGGANEWDLVDVETGDLLIGCEEGLFEKLNWSKIGNQSAFIPGVVSECGMGFVVSGWILAYDGDKLANGPKSWADFFDLAAFPGKRAMRNGPVFNLEVALMGDGVPPEQVYKVLSTPQGVDRAFKKLDTIKKNMVWWQTGAQPAQLLASGEVVMADIFNGRIYNANKNDHKNFKIVWNQEILSFDHWVIMRGSPNLDAAYKFLSFYAKPENEKDFPNYIPNGLPNKDTNRLIAKDMLPNMPTNAEYLPHALQFDAKFWLDNTDKLTERFNKWVAQ
jgi:putative spermidine/putrescine transport system substrate-binding protein